MARSFNNSSPRIIAFVSSGCPRVRNAGVVPGLLLFLAAFAMPALVPCASYAGNTLTSLEDELAAIVENVKSSVVTVTSQYDLRKTTGLAWPLDRLHLQVTPQGSFLRRSVGSGIVFAEEIVVTSGSVVKSAKEVTVAFESGRSYQAEVLGTDRFANVCVLRISGLRVKPVPLGSSKSVRIGSLVVVMGNSFGRLPTVALGTVSGRQRVARTQGKWEIIQLTGPVHPGNSGGAVLNTKGELVAMLMGKLAGEMRPGVLQGSPEFAQEVEAFAVGSGSVGLALPAEEVRSVVDALLKTGYVSEGYLGVKIQSYASTGAITRIGLSTAPGVELSEVVTNSPAARAGLQNGDIVSEFDNEPVFDPAQLGQMVSATRPGERIKMAFWRGTKRLSTTVVMGATGPSQSGLLAGPKPQRPIQKPTERILSTEN